MQFKHPEILYGLLLLIIPIIVHLFQLQRFVKTPFTNVKFLQQITLQTRKSSQLKKWLILLMRLGAFTALILAFSQPYFPNKNNSKSSTTFIYLDNSFSMQLKINGVEKLKTATQSIIDNLGDIKNISLLTNNHFFKNIDTEIFKKELLNLTYTPHKKDFKSIFIKTNSLLNTEINSLDDVILISDFQEIKKTDVLNVTNVNSAISLIDVSSKNPKNIAIDSVYISNQNNQEITLKVSISNLNSPRKNIPISLYNHDKLIGKATASIFKNSSSEVEFKIPTQKNIQGKISLEDENLTFDNKLYFTIINSEKTDVLSIGKSNSFLSKIYTPDEFNFTQKNTENLDYNSISKNQLVVLNELNNFPVSLINTLQTFINNGGSLVIIPSDEIDLSSYNLLLKNLRLGTVSPPQKKELKITEINYNHPLLDKVFEKQVTNYNYPTTNLTYKTRLNNASAIIQLENSKPFISEIKRGKGKIYWFSTPLNKSTSNFTNSPLVVPVFYNFGKYSFATPQLYYTIGTKNTISIKTTTKKDELLKIKNKTGEFIPLQQLFHNKITITTSDIPDKSGFYYITKEKDTLRTIAFNYNRNENKFKTNKLKELFKDAKNSTISDSIKDTFIQINKQQQIKPLFKWFLGLAILFLLLEIAILKFFKV